MRWILIAVIAALIVASPIVLATSCFTCCFSGPAPKAETSSCCGGERPAPAAPAADCRCELGDPLASSGATPIAIPASADLGPSLAIFDGADLALSRRSVARDERAAAPSRARAAPLSMRC